jgi:uncharacterized protein (DUF1697 family)
MTRFVSFLRAINVGGHTVTMAELRALFESLGLQQVETFIASGNVIFESPSKDASALERKIQDHLAKSLRYEVATFIRTAAEVGAIARHVSVKASQVEAATAVNVGFVADPLEAKAKSVLLGLKSAIDDFHVHGREVYWFCKKKQSESRFSNVVFERTLKTRATWRGLNTVVKLAAKYPG